MKELTGHRKRLKDRFFNLPIRSLPDYELLELLLFYIIPLRDTKPTAKKLLQKFGSFINVLNADAEGLKQVEGIGQSAELYFKLLKDVFSRLHLPIDPKETHVLSNWNAVISYCNLTMGFQKIETFKILYLNAKNILIHEETLNSGTVDKVAVHPREIVKTSLSCGALAVILVHNHPSGDVSPSKQDISLTNKIISALEVVGVLVHDHIIISGNDYYSFKSNGLI